MGQQELRNESAELRGKDRLLLARAALLALQALAYTVRYGAH